LAISRIIHLHSLGGSIGLTVWLQFAIACFGCGFTPKSTLPWWSGTPIYTMCHWTAIVPAKWHLSPLNGLSVSQKCDRQTDRLHYGEMCRNRLDGKICTARAFLPNNKCIKSHDRWRHDNRHCHLLRQHQAKYAKL